jgi:hypothetical protein
MDDTEAVSHALDQLDTAETKSLAPIRVPEGRR